MLAYLVTSITRTIDQLLLSCVELWLWIPSIMAPERNSTTLLGVLAQTQDCSLLLSHLKPSDARNLSVTCRELSELCFQQCKHISLDAAAVPADPRRFGNCESVQCKGIRAEVVVETGTLLLPALARLPKLHILQLATRDHGSGSRVMALLLELVRLHLTGLDDLLIAEGGSWGKSGIAWQVLGRCTNLQKLAVMFEPNKDSVKPVNFTHLTALNPLSSTLQSLEVTANNIQPGSQDYSFVGSLTSLTHLSLTLVTTTGLTSIAACTKLRSLHLLADGQQRNQRPTLQEDEYAALASLTELTELRLHKIGGTGDTGEFLTALRCLQQLEVLRVDDLNRRALPALAALKKLTELGSYWQEDDNISASGTVCNVPNVRLLGANTSAPLQAFKHVEHVQVWNTWSANQYSAVAQHCKNLAWLNAVSDDLSVASMPYDTPIAQRSAALRSLAGLKHLTRLHFAPVSDTDLAELPKFSALVSLRLVLPKDTSCTGTCTLAGLMHVCLLPRLRDLSIVLPGITSFSVFEACSIITGFQRVAQLALYVCTSCLEVFQEASDMVLSEGLPRPRKLSIHDEWPGADLV